MWGLPETCSYGCGKLFVPFIELCGDMLETLSHAAAGESTMVAYHAFQAKCLQLDPQTMVLAIDRSVCVTCGDGEVSGGEDCDDGLEGNSDEPDAHCRPDCHLARCGDGIVDRGEECDLGALNSDDATEEDQCMADCTAPVHCPALPAVDGATITLSNTDRRASTATYTCYVDGGAPSDGDASRVCQADGSWSGTAPTACLPAGAEEQWDSTQSGRTIQGRTFTLFKMTAAEYRDSKQGGHGAVDYGHACDAVNLQGIGCPGDVFPRWPGTQYSSNGVALENMAHSYPGEDVHDWTGWGSTVFYECSANGYTRCVDSSGNMGNCWGSLSPVCIRLHP